MRIWEKKILCWRFLNVLRMHVLEMLEFLRRSIIGQGRFERVPIWSYVRQSYWAYNAASLQTNGDGFVFAL